MLPKSEEIITLARRNLLEVFGERDPELRASTVREIYSENVSFADPDETVVGWEALEQKAAGLLEGAPGFVFQPVGEVRTVQNLALLAWQFGPEGGDPVVSGLDISIVENGRIVSLYTSLDQPA